MTYFHPDGMAMTQKLWSLGTGLIPENASILDLGCKDGETVRYLREMGYESYGIDLAPASNPYLLEGDFCEEHFKPGTFDVVMAECSISLCKDARRVFEQVHRILKETGIFLCSDVYFSPLPGHHAPALSFEHPATKQCWQEALLEEGLLPVLFFDETASWKRYYAQQLWDGVHLCSKWGCGSDWEKESRVGYFLMMSLRRNEEYGVV